mmetsp:Transcript_6795/g.12611  ORF Transcript_6795/g.12611 Transcript_6795/m.12611 type:complete len:89 (-) Transcript_6795:344-610(-)|eukprot:CAMPEP_0171906014 /NCGR_PEP_ID=MMETSP0993-20121228/5654_1 /TAXON_ID=483369 /ORGANISM="non described non described, Strain CCMP2098" /LENGTH=88 /DNA_ID=CAMNT_0012537677 /DNA_START=96 /DNA_END=362 /DNA_ORIENTATION=-
MSQTSQIKSVLVPVDSFEPLRTSIQSTFGDVKDKVDDLLFGVECKLRAVCDVCDFNIDDDDCGSNDPTRFDCTADSALCLAEEGRVPT